MGFTVFAAIDLPFKIHHKQPPHLWIESRKAPTNNLPFSILTRKQKTLSCCLIYTNQNFIGSIKLGVLWCCNKQEMWMGKRYNVCSQLFTFFNVFSLFLFFASSTKKSGTTCILHQLHFLYILISFFFFNYWSYITPYFLHFIPFVYFSWRFACNCNCLSSPQVL